MIPTRLTIQGLYSYREPQTIDFTKLTQAGLFGIFGGVGSGKSSILEAISFAIYGKTERLNERENRNYNMMNLKSNELLIDFEFKGNDQVLYRFVVNGKRNGKNFDDVKTFDRKAYKKESESWIPIETDLAESITGLKYDNFKRTIIIPQGRFQEFLQLGTTERVGMLKELFNLQKYDLSKKVSDLEDKNEAALNIVKGQLQEVGEINSETIETKENELKLLTETLQQKRTEYDEKLNQHQELVKLQQLTATIKTEQDKLEIFQNSENEIVALESEINQYEAISFIFSTDLEYFDRLQKTIETCSFEVQNQQLEVNQHSNKEQELKAVFAEIKPTFDTNQLLATEADELNKLAEMKDSTINAETLKARIEKGKTVVHEMANVIQFLKETNHKLTADIDEHKKSLPDIKVLHDVKAWFSDKNRLNTIVNDAIKRNAVNATSKRTLQIHILKLYTEANLFSDQPEIADIDTFLSSTNSLKLSLETEKGILDAKISRIAVQHELEQYVHALTEGKPCPLCGSENHPQKLNVENVEKIFYQLKEQKTILETKIKGSDTLEKNLIRAQAEILNATNQEKIDEAAFQLAMSNAQKLAASFAWGNYDPNNSELLNTAFDRYNHLYDLITKSETTLQITNKEIEKKEFEKDKSITALRSFEDQLNSLNAKVSLLTSQIQHIDILAFLNIEVEEIRTLSAEKLRMQKDIIHRFNTTDLELKNNQQVLSGLMGKLGQTTIMFKNLQSEQITLQQTITKKLTQNNGISLEFVRSILKKNLQLDILKKRVSKFRQEMASLKDYITKLELDRAGRIYDAQAHELLKSQILDLKQFTEIETKKIGMLTNELERLKAAAIQFTKLKLECDTLTLRAEDITELKRLFFKNAFIDFVSTVHLQNLCYAANDRLLKLTRQQLGIELASDNSFVVRDYMNEGKTRSVKTLSGGQTFQASLSLALSLADSIHAQSGTSENFFFLDEGFGSLDKDTLSIVFESLKALRKENRIVGFISHVEEMQQQIETYIRVENNDENGSVVKRSWEEN